jgi:hypothetical protein
MDMVAFLRTKSKPGTTAFTAAQLNGAQQTPLPAVHI